VKYSRVYNLKSLVSFELAISLVISIAHSVNSVLVLDHFSSTISNILHKGYGVVSATSDVKLF
jgi:hypothetical protein